jgi:hypothetical protein
METRPKRKTEYSNRFLTWLIRIMLATQAVLAVGQLLLMLLVMLKLR